MDPIQNVIVSAQMTDIPMSIMSSQAKKPIPADQPRQYALNPTSGANATAGSIISFQIPPQSNAFLKSGSLYLKFTLTQAISAGATGFNYGNGSQDCSSMFSRVSTFLGATQLEINQNYDYLTTLLMEHVAGSSYGLNDFVIMTKLNGTGADVDNSAGAVSSSQIMPLLCGWCNSDQNVPLCLLKEPIVINFDVNASARALKYAGAVANNFSLTNLQLCYETVRVDNQYVQALRDQINSGKLYSMNFITPLGLQFSGAIGSTTYNAGLGLSSIRGIAISPILDSRAVSTAVKAPSKNTLSNARFYIDGNLVCNFNLDDTAQQYASLNNTFGALFSRTSCSVNLTGAGSAMTRTTYEDPCFAVGVGTEKFNEKGLSFAGSQCSNLQVILDGLTAVATQYMYIFHDTLLIVASDSSSSIVR
jgi:hypothetical protein